MIKIAIDLRPTQINYSGRGIGNYTENLMQALYEIDEKNEYCLLYHPTYKVQIPKNLKDNFVFYPLPLPIKKPFKGYYIYFDQIVLPRLLKQLSVDVYHSPDFNLPFFQPCNLVTTIYDLALLKYPYLTGHSRLEHLIYKWKLYNAQKAAAIITISEYSKRDLQNLLYIKEEKITVIYPSYEPIIEISGTETSASLTKLDVTSPYLLYVGGLNNRLKNLELLLEAFAQISNKYDSLKLVICGQNEGKYFTQAFQFYTGLSHKFGINNRVIFSGAVSKETLQLFYKYAMLLVFPSRHEGFGLPIIEAMSLDCPVLASQATAIPEAVGEGGMLFEDDNLPDLVNKLQQILDNPSLRMELIKRGRERVKFLSWRKAAEETMAVYEKAGRKR